MPPAKDLPPSPLLLYDGACALCSGAVRFVLRHDRRGSLRFASLDGPTARALLAGRPELRDLDSMLFVEAAGGPAFSKSEAALHVAAYLGGPWRLALLLRAIPRALRDRGYDFVARHRHRFSEGEPSCSLLPSGMEGRFSE